MGLPKRNWGPWFVVATVTVLSTFLMILPVIAQEEEEWTLTVEGAGNGSGFVEGVIEFFGEEETVIECSMNEGETSGVCAHSEPAFQDPPDIELTADPDEGFVFDGWSGCDEAFEGVCHVRLDEDHTVTATFQSECEAPPSPSIDDVSPGRTVEVDTFVTIEGSADNPQGCQDLALSWQLGASPEGSRASLAPSVGSQTTLHVDEAGRYVAVLIARNEHGVAATEVTIEATDEAPPDDDDTEDESEGPPGKPFISSIEPAVGAPGTLVVIRGRNFASNPNVIRVFFGEKEQPAIAASQSSVSVRVPPLPDGEVLLTVSVNRTGSAVINLSTWPMVLPIRLTQAEPSNTVRFRISRAAQQRTPTSEDLRAGFMIGQALIFFEDGVSDSEIDEIQAEHGIRELIPFPQLGFHHALLNTENPAETERILESLRADPRIRDAFRNDLQDLLQVDPRVEDQTWLRAMGLPEGWRHFPKRGEDVTVAVIDSGIDLQLPKSDAPELFTPSFAPQGLNYAPQADENAARDDIGHGTSVSTIATGALNDFNGAGVAPRASVLPIKVFARVDGEEKTSLDLVVQGLGAAFAKGVDVVNMSIGCEGCSADQEAEIGRFYRRVLENLREKHSEAPIIVASSGNDGEELIDAPASLPRTLAVGSVGLDLVERSRFSNHGAELDVVAVGEQIETTVLQGEFASAGNGTSFAAPQVAGMVALLLAEEPNLSVEAVRERLQTCFTEDLGPEGFDQETGWGRLVIPLEDAEIPADCTAS